MSATPESDADNREAKRDMCIDATEELSVRVSRPIPRHKFALAYTFILELRGTSWPWGSQPMRLRSAMSFDHTANAPGKLVKI